MVDYGLRNVELLTAINTVQKVELNATQNYRLQQKKYNGLNYSKIESLLAIYGGRM